MIRRFFRHLIESLKSLKRNGWMTIAAVSSVMITLSLVAIFASVIANTISSRSESEPEQGAQSVGVDAKPSDLHLSRLKSR